MAVPPRPRCKNSFACEASVVLFLLLCTLTVFCTGSTAQTDGVMLPLLHWTSLPPPYTRHFKLDVFAEARDLDRARYLALASMLKGSSVGLKAAVNFKSNAVRNLTGVRTSVRSGASAGAGQYFVQLSLGTPPQKFLVIADTGSDLVWVRCSNCWRSCSDEGSSGGAGGGPGSTGGGPGGSGGNGGGSAGGNGGAGASSPPPTFLARESSTYRAIPCLSSDCLLVPAPPSFSCNLRLPSTCRYDYTYTDTSESIGVFSMDTVSLDAASVSPSSSTIGQVPDFAFGCGLHNEGQSFVGSDGVLGMGRGPISFVSQVGVVVGNKFSYCLVDFFHTPPLNSFLFLGDLPPSLKPSAGFQSTPLLQNPFGQSLYYVGVEQVRVNGQALSIPSYVWDIDSTGNGGTVVDSGTTLSVFVEPAYTDILDAITRSFPFPQVDPVQNFDLCFNATGISDLSRLPTLSIVFQGNAIFAPPPSNVFIDVPGGLKCLGLQGVESPFGFSVLGNLIQQEFQMVFDLDASRLSFAPAQCGDRFKS